MVKNKLPNGKGRMTRGNTIYQGEFVDGVSEGFGVFVDRDDNGGSFYEGNWVDDYQHGEGVEVWNNNEFKYTGTFENGQKSGEGRFEQLDGSYYQGQFKDGGFEGHGVYYFADDGSIYEGEFANN